MGLYRLHGRRAVPCKDVLTWATAFERSKRQVADDTVGKIRLSTVFLGIDHNHFGKGPPLLFETMIFGGPREGIVGRWATWEEALEMHQAVLRSDISKAADTSTIYTGRNLKSLL